MRRADREITGFDDLVEVIKNCDVIRLGLSDDGMPYIVPMNFGYEVEDGSITFYMHCAREGRKIDILRKNRNVCFELDCGHRLCLSENSAECTMAYECVMGTGTVELVETAVEKLKGLQKLLENYGRKGMPIDERIANVTTVLKLTVSEMTGKRHKGF